MEEDEDVVYEGSALYEHLHATGFTDFEADSRITSSVCEDHQQVTTNPMSDASVDQTINSMSVFCDSSMVKEKELDCLRQKVAHLLLDCGLLNKDDMLFLEHFSPSASKILLKKEALNEVSNKCQSSGETENRIMSNSLSSFGWLALGLSIFVGICSLEDEEDSNNKLKRRWQLLILGFIMTIIFILLRVRGKMKQPYKDAIIKLDDLLSQLQAMSILCGSSLRILQETHLISKGFVLATGSDKLQTGFDADESFHCKFLREALSQMLQSASQFLFTAHSALSTFRSEHKYPLIVEIFELEEKDQLNLSNLSLKELKIQKDILKLQISTVLAELMLKLDSSNTFCDSFLTSFQEIFDADLFKKTQTLCHTVLKKANYIRSYWSQAESQDDNGQINFEEKKKDVYIAIHSLNLHMQAALHKIKLVENCFNESMEDNNSYSCYEEVKHKMELIKAEIDLSLGCWDEASTRLDKRYGKLTSDDKVPKLTNTIPADEIEKENLKQNTKTVRELKDPIIEDEVFEALIDHDCSQTYAEYDEESDLWNSNQQKEREKLRNQKEQGKRVLKELQPILVKRREVWEERENIALRRMNKMVNDTEGTLDNLIDASDNQNLLKNTYNDAEDMHDIEVATEINNAECENLSSLDYEEEINFNTKLIKFQDQVISSSNNDESENVNSPKSDQIDYSPSREFNINDKEDNFKKSKVQIFNSQIQNENDLKSPCAIFNTERQDSYDSDEERLKLYHAVKSSLNHESSSPIHHARRRDSYDSDDERLELYHNVKLSLDNEKLSNPTQNVQNKCKELSDNYITDNDSDSNSEDNEETLLDSKFKSKPGLNWDLPPPVSKETLEDRLSIISGNRCLNFHAELSVEAVAASRNLNSNNKEDFFGGVGDGEVFGSSTESSDTDD